MAEEYGTFTIEPTKEAMVYFAHELGLWHPEPGDNRSVEDLTLTELSALCKVECETEMNLKYKKHKTYLWKKGKLEIKNPKKELKAKFKDKPE